MTTRKELVEALRARYRDAAVADKQLVAGFGRRRFTRDRALSGGIELTAVHI